MWNIFTKLLWKLSGWCKHYLFYHKQKTKYSLYFMSFYLLLCCLCGLTELAETVNVLPQKEKYFPDYSLYHNLTTIAEELNSIVRRNPNYIKIDWVYQSRQHRSQLLLHITNFTGSVSNSVSYSHLGDIPKVKVLLSFGEHARELLPVESMFYLLNNLTSGLSAVYGSPSEQFSRKILSKIDLFIIVMANPDGRHHVETTQNFCWRGTSTGVDLNRNFDWEFGEKGSSDDKTDEEYRGEHPTSEPECLVYTELTAKSQFDVFVSFHSGTRQIYAPFSDTKSKKTNRQPAMIQDILDLASELSHSTKYSFRYGIAHRLSPYTADGTIFDYMAGVRKIPFSLAVELWGTSHQGSSCFDLFNPPNDDLQGVVENLHPLYVTMFLHLIQWKENQIRYKMDPMHEAPGLTFGFILLGFVVCLTVVVAVHMRKTLSGWLFQRKRIVSLRSLSSTFTVSFAER